MRPTLPLALLLGLLPAAPRALAGDGAAAEFAREGEKAAEGRDFALAAQKFAAAAASAPAGRDRDAWTGRREDMELARDGLAALVRAVTADPDRFGKVDAGRGLVVNVRSADALGIHATLTGGTTDMRWASMDRRLLAALVDRARPEQAVLLPMAALLRCYGEEDGAEQLLIAHLQAGGDAGRVSRIWARWLGEEVPRGGYVEHQGSLVSLEDRRLMEVEDRKAAAYAKLMSGDAAARRAGFEELKSLGEPAKWTLYKGLRARRAEVVRRLAEMKVLTAPSTRAKLKEELKVRRDAALALIEDEKAYPYPSETHVGQVDVDRLVERVREIWERPFLVVAGWEPEAAEGLKGIAEVDGMIAEVEPGYEPDVAAVMGPLNAVIDVPGMVFEEESAKVLEYNRKVRTTATPEERENVLAVNEYRIMMGRRAVRIHERLVRAARGHSRHMRLNGYFSHNSAYPGLENPQKRAARQGYSGGVGENISMGRPTGRGAFDAWFHSSGHHRNMIRAGWREMGAGKSQTHFTQLFGAAGGDSLKEPDPLAPPEPDVAPDLTEADGPPEGG